MFRVIQQIGNKELMQREKTSFKLAPSKDGPNAFVCEPSQLIPFKRTNTDAPLCFAEFHLKNIAPSATPKKPLPTYMEKAREKHPYAYKPWLPADDEQLKRLYQSGKTVQELSINFGRQRGAIRSRLKKLGLFE